MIRSAAITDEFSPDFERALVGMAEVGMTGVELRVIDGKNVLECDDREIDRVRTAVERAGMTVVSIASPVLKCVLPTGPAIDTRFAQDVFGAAYSFDDQARLSARAFAVAQRCGAPVIRVFSYWRTVRPEECFDAVIAALRRLGDQAGDLNITIGVENEHACNVGTGAEAARLLTALNHPQVGLVWDPANASVAGEVPYPDGYRNMSTPRIVHVHAKDCRVHDHVPTWGALGQMDIDWPGQIAALRADGYDGYISLETHWRGPNDDKYEASLICGRALRTMLSARD